MDEFQILTRGNEVYTEGLAAHGLPELAAGVRDSDLIEGAQDLVRDIAAYMLMPGVHVLSNETFGYGYWQVKFVDEGPGRFRLWDADLDEGDVERFVPWLGLVIRFWQAQNVICDRFGAEFMPPNPEQLVAISDGVYAGDPVSGVRYHTPEADMSGWYLTTDRYNNDYRTLIFAHLFHVTKRRPDVAPFIALPPGFRFSTVNGRVWFDQTAADEKPRREDTKHVVRKKRRRIRRN